MRTYDEIYGISLKEYCEAQGIKQDKLISMVEKDIEILRRNLHRHAREVPDFQEDWDLIAEIKRTLDKKEKHLKRLKEYSKRSTNE